MRDSEDNRVSRASVDGAACAARCPTAVAARVTFARAFADLPALRAAFSFVRSFASSARCDFAARFAAAPFASSFRIFAAARFSAACAPRVAFAFVEASERFVELRDFEDGARGRPAFPPRGFAGDFLPVGFEVVGRVGFFGSFTHRFPAPFP